MSYKLRFYSTPIVSNPGLGCPPLSNACGLKQLRHSTWAYEILGKETFVKTGVPKMCGRYFQLALFLKLSEVKFDFSIYNVE